VHIFVKKAAIALTFFKNNSKMEKLENNGVLWNFFRSMQMEQ
jgi:hypothetical protein